MQRFWIQQIFPFLRWIPLVNGTTLRDDFFAGITGAVLGLPQGVAYAMIAGLPPVYGLYTSMITPVISALWGSSYHLIAGPTTTASIVVYAAIAENMPGAGPEMFISLAITLAFVAGFFQFAMGLARLGNLVNFVSPTVILGFTAGAALLIASGQLKHAVGLSIPGGMSFGANLSALFTQCGNWQGYSILIASVTIASALLIKKIQSRLPYLLLAMIVASYVAYMLNKEGANLQMIGAMPAGLPSFSADFFSLSIFIKIAPDAFAIALLGLIEAVAIARAIATSSGQILDSNKEFTGLGLANMIGSFFQCYPGSGSYTRSGANYQAGAKTPMAAIFAGIFMAFILLWLSSFSTYLPSSAMGGIILLVALKLIDIKRLRTILKNSPRERVVLAITFFATISFDLVFAILAGVIISLYLHLRDISRPRMVILAADVSLPGLKLLSTWRQPELQVCPQIQFIRIDGSLYFGSVDHVQQELKSITDEAPEHVVYVMSGVNQIDLSGAEFLVVESRRMALQGRKLYLSNVKVGVRNYLQKGGYLKEIGENHMFLEEINALDFLLPHLKSSICKPCKIRCFHNCPIH